MKTIKHEDIKPFPYELINAKDTVWIKLTDALEMVSEAQKEIRNKEKSE